MIGNYRFRMPYFLFLFALAGCATLGSIRHEYIMRGQILETNGDMVYLCVGSADGASPGQVLTVYKFVKTGSLGPKSGAKYERVETGKVRITEIVDEHMANAKIISGEARENYVVELH